MLYVILGFTRKRPLDNVAGVNEYVETGGCYGNIKYEQKPSTHKLVKKTSAVYGHTLPDKNTLMLLLQKKKNVCLCLEKINALLIVAQALTLAVEDAFTTEEQRKQIDGRQ